MQLLESPIPPLTAAALRMIICKSRPLISTTKKRAWKFLFETHHSEIKCVLSVKESNFNEKRFNILTFAYGQGRWGWPPLPPSLTVSLTIKYSFFSRLAWAQVCDNLVWVNILKDFVTTPEWGRKKWEKWQKKGKGQRAQKWQTESNPITMAPTVWFVLSPVGPNPTKQMCTHSQLMCTLY